MKTIISSNGQSQYCFTLVELYVILCILAILFAIILPRLAQSKEFARDTLCLSNTMQLATALQCYLQDNDMEIPLVTYFLTDFTPYHQYVKSFGIYKCPSSNTPEITSESQLVTDTDYMTSGTLQDMERNSGYNNGLGNNPYHFDPGNAGTPTQNMVKAKGDRNDRIIYERNYRNHIKGRRSFNVGYVQDLHGAREFDGMTKYWTLDSRGWIETSLSPWP